MRGRRHRGYQVRVTDVEERPFTEFVCNKPKSATMSHIVFKRARLCAQSVKKHTFWVLNTLPGIWWWDGSTTNVFVISPIQ